jgi:ATP-dependent DNA ligase
VGGGRDGVLRPPLPVMTAKPAEVLPAGGHWWWEPKLDGFRALAFRDRAGRVRLQSRQQRDLTRYFPNVAAAIAEQLDGDVVLDGELVIAVGGRCDFGELQRRLGEPRADGPAACLVVFDLLSAAGRDQRGNPYRVRRGRLVELLADARLPLAVTPATDDRVVAEAWLHRHLAAGVEGVVAKRTDHAYLPGRRSWVKVRARTTAEAVVGGVLGRPGGPTSLVLGRPDPSGRLRVIGRTTPLSAPAHHELAAVLAVTGDEHPWPALLPATRFGQWPGELVEYLRVDPTVVIEVDVDAAWEWGRYRHPVRYRRLRPDLRPEDLVLLP